MEGGHYSVGRHNKTRSGWAETSVGQCRERAGEDTTICSEVTHTETHREIHSVTHRETHRETHSVTHRDTHRDMHRDTQ